MLRVIAFQGPQPGQCQSKESKRNLSKRSHENQAVPFDGACQFAAVGHGCAVPPPLMRAGALRFITSHQEEPLSFHKTFHEDRLLAGGNV